MKMRVLTLTYHKKVECQGEDDYCDADEGCRSDDVDCIDDRNFDEDDYDG